MDSADSLARLECGHGGPSTGSNGYHPCLSSLQEVEFDCWEESSLPPLHKSTAIEDVAHSMVDVGDRIENLLPDSERRPSPSLASARAVFDSLHPCHGNEVTVPATSVTFVDADDVVATAIWDTGASYSIISKRTAVRFGGRALLRPTDGGPSFTLADKTVVRSLASISLSVKISAKGTHSPPFLGPPRSILRPHFWV